MRNIMLSLGRTLFHDEMGVPSSDMKFSQSRVVIEPGGLSFDGVTQPIGSLLRDLIIRSQTGACRNFFFWLQRLRSAHSSTEQRWHGGPHPRLSCAQRCSQRHLGHMSRDHLHIIIDQLLQINCFNRRVKLVRLFHHQFDQR